MSFSYDISVRVNQTLATVSSSLYRLGFCTAAASVVAPPALQLALAGSGTAASNAVIAKCYTVGTSAAVIVASAPFGTNATATTVYIKENSTNTAAFVVVSENGGTEDIMTLKNGAAAFFSPTNVGYGARSTNAASTASLQIVIVGE
jgi:hypothetical protein